MLCTASHAFPINSSCQGMLRTPHGSMGGQLCVCSAAHLASSLSLLSHCLASGSYCCAPIRSCKVLRPMLVLYHAYCLRFLLASHPADSATFRTMSMIFARRRFVLGIRFLSCIAACTQLLLRPSLLVSILSARNSVVEVSWVMGQFLHQELCTRFFSPFALDIRPILSSCGTH